MFFHLVLNHNVLLVQAEHFVESIDLRFDAVNILQVELLSFVLEVDELLLLHLDLSHFLKSLDHQQLQSLGWSVQQMLALMKK